MLKKIPRKNKQNTTKIQRKISASSILADNAKNKFKSKKKITVFAYMYIAK